MLESRFSIRTVRRSVWHVSLRYFFVGYVAYFKGHFVDTNTTYELT